ncbi:MAG: hypothetical protein OMM_11424, partial [Candidatus Magnetoglobus multicellularis str. Araruama]
MGDTWLEQAVLLDPDNDGWDFASSVSISGEFAIIGKTRGSDNGISSGYAYIYKQVGDSWTKQAKLLPSDGDNGDFFGKSVSISGDYAAIQSYKSTYLFQKCGEHWIETNQNNYGNIFSTSEEYVISGFAHDNNMTGAAYVYAMNQSPILTVATLHSEVSEYAGAISIGIKIYNTEHKSVKWSATTDASWLNIKSGSTGINEGSILLKYNKNSMDERIAEVKVTVPQAIQGIQTVTIKQKKNK